MLDIREKVKWPMVLPLRQVSVLRLVHLLFTWDNTGLSVALFLLRVIPQTVCTTVGRGWTVTESLSALTSSTTALGTLRPVSPRSQVTINRTYRVKLKYSNDLIKSEWSLYFGSNSIHFNLICSKMEWIHTRVFWNLMCSPLGKIWEQNNYGSLFLKELLL